MGTPPYILALVRAVDPLLICSSSDPSQGLYAQKRTQREPHRSSERSSPAQGHRYGSASSSFLLLYTAESTSLDPSPHNRP